MLNLHNKLHPCKLHRWQSASSPFDFDIFFPIGSFYDFLGPFLRAGLPRWGLSNAHRFCSQWYRTGLHFHPTSARRPRSSIQQRGDSRGRKRSHRLTYIGLRQWPLRHLFLNRSNFSAHCGQRHFWVDWVQTDHRPDDSCMSHLVPDLFLVQRRLQYI